MDGAKLPKIAYVLDESDPDVLLLRRKDGSFVAAFSAQGATKEGIVGAAEGDYRALLEEYADSPTCQTEALLPKKEKAGR
jgi:hypothetical protein